MHPATQGQLHGLVELLAFGELLAMVAPPVRLLALQAKHSGSAGGAAGGAAGWAATGLVSCGTTHRA